MTLHLLLTTTFALAAGWAVYTDFRYRRISNRLTLGVAASALAARLVLGGPEAGLAGLEGWVLGAALLILPFALGWMGAGDVKLLAGFGALGGPQFVLQAALLGSIAGGAIALVYLARERKLWQTFVFLPAYVRHPLGTVLETKRRMPFGPALVLGGAATMALTRTML
jgi:prepilin peptidase CpaA